MQIWVLYPIILCSLKTVCEQTVNNEIFYFVLPQMTVNV